jgi:hypothetical protein
LLGVPLPSAFRVCGDPGREALQVMVFRLLARLTGSPERAESGVPKRPERPAIRQATVPAVPHAGRLVPLRCAASEGGKVLGRNLTCQWLTRFSGASENRLAHCGRGQCRARFPGHASGAAEILWRVSVRISLGTKMPAISMPGVAGIWSVAPV